MSSYDKYLQDEPLIHYSIYTFRRPSLLSQQKSPRPPRQLQTTPDLDEKMNTSRWMSSGSRIGQPFTCAESDALTIGRERARKRECRLRGRTASEYIVGREEQRDRTTPRTP